MTKYHNYNGYLAPISANSAKDSQVSRFSLREHALLGRSGGLTLDSRVGLLDLGRTANPQTKSLWISEGLTQADPYV